MGFKLTVYLKKITETFTEFQTEGEHFARASSITELDEILAKLRSLKGFILVAIDSRDGNMGDRGHDHYRDEPHHRFYILQKVKLLDHDAKERALDDCKALGKKIIYKMLTDRTNGKNGLRFVDLSRIHYMTVGPIGDNCHGIEMFVDTVEKMWEQLPVLNADENFEL